MEAQIESAGDSPSPLPKPDDVECDRKREKSTLLLSRKRVLQQIQASNHPRFRDMLAVALADLDKKLAEFD